MQISFQSRTFRKLFLGFLELSTFLTNFRTKASLGLLDTFSQKFSLTVMFFCLQLFAIHSFASVFEFLIFFFQKTEDEKLANLLFETPKFLPAVSVFSFQYKNFG